MTTDTPSTGLSAQLHHDLTEAIRSGDKLVSSTLRLAIAAIQSEEVAGKAKKTLTEPEVIAVLGREVRKRREASLAFAEGGRADRSEAELAEAAVLEAYLPQQLTDEEVEALVTRILAAEGLEGPRAIGAAMKAVNAEIASTFGPGRVEGSRVAASVKRHLTA